MESYENRLLKLFEDAEYEILNHKHLHTAEESSEFRKHDLKQAVKAILLKTKTGEFYLFALPGDKKIDLKKVKAILEEKAKLANPREVYEITGCEIGSVPPIGQLKNIKTFVDFDVYLNDYIYFSLASHTKSLKIKSKYYKKYVVQEIKSFSC